MSRNQAGYPILTERTGARGVRLGYGCPDDLTSCSEVGSGKYAPPERVEQMFEIPEKAREHYDRTIEALLHCLGEPEEEGEKYEPIDDFEPDPGAAVSFDNVVITSTGKTLKGKKVASSLCE